MIEEKLKIIFKEIFANEDLQISYETSPDDIPDWDSLTQVLLVEEIEKTFHISIDMDDVFKIRTFGDFVQTVEKNTNR